MLLRPLPLSRAPTIRCRATSKDSKCSRKVHAIRDDLKSLYNYRVSSLVAIDTLVRDLVAKDLEMRKSLLSKWVATAKDECTTTITSEPQNTKPTTESQATAESPSSDGPYYEPWVIDD